MPNDQASSTTHSVPPFKSQLPEGLLANLSETERHFYNTLDEVKQTVSWSARLSAATANKLEEVHVQVLATNGRLLKAESSATELKSVVEAQKVETAPLIRAYKVSETLVRSKVFWGLATAFLIVGIPFIVNHAPDPQKALVTAVKWALGMM